tara:strand:- start:79985 stop:80398 length:414 start_codon:yes stop_codon:yes gene_type:complete
MSYAYDLLYVTIGNEEVGARPTAWDAQDETGQGVDIAGKEINAIAWMTTCPGCGEMVDVLKPGLYIATDGTEFCFSCISCGAGKEVKKLQFSTEVEVVKKETPDVAVFIDPIKEGLFDNEVDHDVLLSLDEGLIELF